MNSVKVLSIFPCPSSSYNAFQIRCSFSTNRRRSRRRNQHKPKKLAEISLVEGGSSNNQNLNLVLDINQISANYQQYLSSARDAYKDLQSLVTVDTANKRLLVSCRKSTLIFAGQMLAILLSLILGFRILSKVVSGFKAQLGFGHEDVVVRRDRSLGGKEVVVARRINKIGEHGMRENFGGSKKFFRVRDEDQKLPQWWPVSVTNPVTVAFKEDYQREADRLIRAIMDCRTSGKDVTEDDIIRLRRICRISGVRVSIDTTNSCHTLYRTSVDFLLNICSREPSYCSSVEIDGEDARNFIAGLAENIGLEATRAATMVSAAVAARMRSCFLQAWALELQGKHSEAVSEVSKICVILRTFPPEESSAEMELVARGLEKQLKVDQREFLMNMITGICAPECHTSAAEALGLVRPTLLFP